MDRIDLLRRLAQNATGRPLESLRPVPLAWSEMAEALWPLNERFRPAIERIRSLPYDPAFEAEADEAIGLLADAQPAQWDDISSGAWRVLLERQQQGLTVALANEHAGSRAVPIPEGLNAAQRTAFAAVFLLYAMKLPWPPENRSAFEVPPGSARAPLRPQ